MEEKEEEEEGCGGPRDGRVGTGSQGTGFGRKDPRAPAVPPEWHSELWNSVRRLQREQRRSCPWRLAPALPCPCPALPCPCPCPCPVPPLPCPPPAGSAVPSLIFQPRERSRRGKRYTRQSSAQLPAALSPCFSAFSLFSWVLTSRRVPQSLQVAVPRELVFSLPFRRSEAWKGTGQPPLQCLCSQTALLVPRVRRRHGSRQGRLSPAEAAVQVSSGPPPLAGVCVSSRVHPGCSSG